MHIDEAVLTEGKADWNKIQPLYRVHIQPKMDKGPNGDTREYAAFRILGEDPGAAR